MLISRRTFVTLTLGSILAVGCSNGNRSSAASSPGPAGTGPDPLDPNDWDGVLAAARGQSVNWYLWGGSESINRFVDDTYGPALNRELGTTMLMVTHDLDEARRIADHCIVLQHGRVVTEGRPRDVIGRPTTSAVQLPWSARRQVKTTESRSLRPAETSWLISGSRSSGARP